MPLSRRHKLRIVFINRSCDGTMRRFLFFLIQSSRAVSVPHAYDCCCCDIYNEQLHTSMIKRTVPGMV